MILERSVSVVTSLILIVTATLSTGCYSVERGSYTDLEADQPWINNNMPAAGMVSTFYSSMEVTRWIEWKVENRLLDSRRITKKSEKYLRSKNAWKPLGLRIQNNGTEDAYITDIYSRLVIVAIKPTVVVIGPGETEYYEYAMGGYPGPGRSALPVKQPDGWNKYYVGLTRGFDYGTHVPYDPAPQWFSPDLKIGPRRVEMDSDGVGSIEVPWGRLILTRDGDEWVVTTATPSG